MPKEHRVNTLKRGDVFRDWLVDLLGERIRNKNCHVAVYKIAPASHTVCRYEFEGENYSVIAKFYAEPTGWKTNYDPESSMKREFENLQVVEKIINVHRPLAASRRFNCALVTEYIRGKPLYKYLRSETGLYDRLTAVARLLRKLHDGTQSHYYKEGDFYKFHQTLDQLNLSKELRATFNQLLGEWWWHSAPLDQSIGCMIHHDANPFNYVFRGEKVYALDFESARLHANPVHDLGVMAAELKHHFEFKKHNRAKAEQYIGHFLWHYSKEDLSQFRRITSTLPFFMSLGLLRMNRLRIDHDRGDFVIREALACLRSPELY
jgi:tRNA A-37 threonylcarbamoyl transferase component Bud32